MYLSKHQLLVAAKKLGINEKTAEDLWADLKSSSESDYSKFELPHLLYYFGALIVMLAMAWFAGISWENFGGKGLTAIALAYMTGFILLGSYLWKRKELRVPAGLFITLAVCMIPLAVYGLQKWSGLWVGEEHYIGFFHWIKGGWFLMEAATVIGGFIALYFFRFPFLTAPIYFALWFMSMDIMTLASKTGEPSGFWDWGSRSWSSIGFGIFMIIVAYITDLKVRRDFAFWGYLFGVAAFWIGLLMMPIDSGASNFIYLLIHLFLMLISIVLQRSVFLVFGALGVLRYVMYLYGEYFADSSWFPVILSLTGLCIVLAGIAYQKNRQRIELFIQKLLPKSFSKWIPKQKNRTEED